jgi:hypothetical protein
MNYNFVTIFSVVLVMVSCSESRHCKNSNEISVIPKTSKVKNEKMDSITRITVPSSIINKELSKPDENAPKTKKGAN